MEMRRVGNLEVSVAGLGCNNFGMRIDEDASKQVVDAALDAGVNHFDTADIYGKGRSEEFLGRALGSRRDDAVITSKVGHAGARRRARRQRALRHAPLRREPRPARHRPHRPLPAAPARPRHADHGDALRLRQADRRGQGARDRLLQLQRRAARRGRAGGEGPRRPALRERAERLQPPNRSVEDDVLPVCERLDVLLMPYFPLASGMLTGKYRRGEEHPEGSRLAAWGPMASQFASEEKFDVVERLAEYAEAHGHTLAELALSWLAGTPAVGSVIAGATTPEQVRANAAATTAWALTDTERAEVDALARVGG